MYKLNLKKLFFIFIVLCLFFSKSSAIENKILFKVDNQIITTIDIFNEINYLKILNPEIQNLNEQRLFEISKNSLIREKIKKISLLKVIDEIKIPDELVDQIIISIYNNMNLNSINEYKLFLRKNNLSYNYVKNKITIERLWNEMIFQKFNSKVKIDREKIRDEILNNPDEKLLLAEILFAKSNKNGVKLKYKQILNDINKEGFKTAATIHSVSDTAKRGGNIGWVDKSSLSDGLKTEISILKVGEYTKPILTPSGYLIIQLVDKKTNNNSQENIEKKIERLALLKTNQQLNQFSNIYLNKLTKDVIINEK
tara:strand:- start:904 stop:1836 length:933 start_codon:yes stop_codon:yes gene_type:complete